MRVLKALLTVAAVAALLPIAAGADGDLSGLCPDAASVAPPPLEFAEPVYIDPNRAGGEPVIIAAEDGSLNVSAHAGTTHAFKDPAAAGGAGDFAVGYFNQTLNWRSTDGGQTWSYVGIAGLPAGPHSATSTGFSDPGYAIDGGGNIYNIEIDLANIAVFVSNDDGQSYNVANPEVTAGDRPWIVGGDQPGEAYLYSRLPAQLWKTTTGGITWTPQSVGLPVYGQLFRDPLDPDTFIGPRGGSAAQGFSISTDDGRTWRTVPGPEFASAGDQIFAPIDVDKADGTVYMAQGNGYSGANDRTADGRLEFNWYDRERGEWGLSAPQRLPIPEGDVLWTWMVAGEDGRVALAWYQSPKEGVEAGGANEFYVYVAQTTNAQGTDCDGDGVFTEGVDLPPQWTVANASGRPIAVGEVCLQGTACNASTNFVAGDRRLGDFFQMNYDRAGRLVIASGDTMLRSLTGGPKPVSNPVFIGQSAGASMLETPLPVRETRCLAGLPICGAR